MTTATDEESCYARSRLAEIAHAILSEAPPEAVLFTMFRDSQGKAWNMTMDQLRLLSALTPHGEEAADPAPESHLRDLLAEALDVLDGYADPTGYNDSYGDPLPVDTEVHEGLAAKDMADKIRAALASEEPADA